MHWPSRAEVLTACRVCWERGGMPSAQRQKEAAAAEGRSEDPTTAQVADGMAKPARCTTKHRQRAVDSRGRGRGSTSWQFVHRWGFICSRHCQTICGIFSSLAAVCVLLLPSHAREDDERRPRRSSSCSGPVLGSGSSVAPRSTWHSRSPARRGRWSHCYVLGGDSAEWVSVARRQDEPMSAGAAESSNGRREEWRRGERPSSDGVGSASVPLSSPPARSPSATSRLLQFLLRGRAPRRVPLVSTPSAVAEQRKPLWVRAYRCCGCWRVCFCCLPSTDLSTPPALIRLVLSLIHI